MVDRKAQSERIKAAFDASTPLQEAFARAIEQAMRNRVKTAPPKPQAPTAK
jgi:hypothetical protein